MSILTAILNTLVVIVCLFLICLILIQRGKGGGLAGAFGGVGGSSAFGTKAGDVFTRVTVVVASIWIFLSLILVVLYNRNTHSAWGNEASATASKEVGGKSKAKTGTGTSGTTSPASSPTAPGSSSSSSPAPVAPGSIPALPAGPAPGSTK